MSGCGTKRKLANLHGFLIKRNWSGTDRASLSLNLFFLGKDFWNCCPVCFFVRRRTQCSIFRSPPASLTGVICRVCSTELWSGCCNQQMNVWASLAFVPYRKSILITTVARWNLVPQKSRLGSLNKYGMCAEKHFIHKAEQS